MRPSLLPRLVPVSALAAALCGCAPVGPDYVRPETPHPAQWANARAPGISAASTNAQTLATWWTLLGDPVLVDLVQDAVVGNPGVLEARARVREARARRTVVRADLFPSVQQGVGVTRSHQSEEVFSSGSRNRTLYQGGFDASWELDIFGGVRRGVEAATADVEASEDNLDDVLVSLIGELALAYVDLRATQVRLAIAEANLDTDRETFEIATWRTQAGLTTALDVEQARTSLEETRARIPSLESALVQAVNSLAVLVGKAPEAMADRFDERKPIPVAPLEIAVGVPADTLLRRPDVRRAERQLAAETARVGVATAAKYPSVSLVGSIGLEALSPSGWVSSGADAASAAANLAQTIFDAGRLDANVEAQDALREQAAAQFQASILDALAEVENAMIAFVREQERRSALSEATAAAERAALLSRNQYASGLVDFETVLVAQRSLFSLQDQLASSEGEVTSNLIRLYKALGGGWASTSET